uniref:Uncharacterized protein n=1 Tax=Glossina palpalis gambiensis TaxID=67801 RepID=A0A1B0AUM3_9MUSC
MDGIDLQRLRSTGIIETTGSSFEHDYIKRMALQYLEYTMTNRLKVIRNVNPPMRDTEIAIEMSRGVYSWSYEKFLARRRFKHVWIDVLMWEFDEALLERVKLHFDLSELNRLVDVLFKAMYALVDGKSIDFVFEAIEMRYQLNWYRSEVNKMQLKYDILQENYLNSISQALQASKMEEEVGYNIVDVIYNETESFRELITNFQELYDEELEKIEASIGASTKQIAKLVDHHKYLSEELVRFREEIAARKAFEIRRRQPPSEVYQIDWAAIYSKSSKKRRKGNRKKSKG